MEAELYIAQIDPETQTKLMKIEMPVPQAWHLEVLHRSST